MGSHEGRWAAIGARRVEAFAGHGPWDMDEAGPFDPGAVRRNGRDPGDCGARAKHAGRMLQVRESGLHVHAGMVPLTVGLVLPGQGPDFLDVAEFMQTGGQETRAQHHQDQHAGSAPGRMAPRGESEGVMHGPCHAPIDPDGPRKVPPDGARDWFDRTAAPRAAIP